MVCVKILLVVVVCVMVVCCVAVISRLCVRMRCVEVWSAYCHCCRVKALQQRQRGATHSIVEAPKLRWKHCKRGWTGETTSNFVASFFTMGHPFSRRQYIFYEPFLEHFFWLFSSCGSFDWVLRMNRAKSRDYFLIVTHSCSTNSFTTPCSLSLSF